MSCIALYIVHIAITQRGILWSVLVQAYLYFQELVMQFVLDGNLYKSTTCPIIQYPKMLCVSETNWMKRQYFSFINVCVVYVHIQFGASTTRLFQTISGHQKERIIFHWVTRYYIQFKIYHLIPQAILMEMQFISNRLYIKSNPKTFQCERILLFGKPRFNGDLM